MNRALLFNRHWNKKNVEMYLSFYFSTCIFTGTVVGTCASVHDVIKTETQHNSYPLKLSPQLFFTCGAFGALGAGFGALCGMVAVPAIPVAIVASPYILYKWYDHNKKITKRKKIVYESKLE